MKKTVFLLSTILILTGCANGYYPISNNQNYRNTESNENVDYGYKYDILATNGNKRYAKKEDKFGIDVVSIKITNNTDRELDVNKHINFYISNQEVVPLESTSVTSRLKQSTPIYLLYCLLFLNIDTPSTQATIPIGVGIAAGNMVVAANSNKKFKEEFSRNNIVGKKIPPGETLTGLVAFKDIELGSMKVEIK